jgi:hypothetical protein
MVATTSTPSRVDAGVYRTTTRIAPAPSGNGLRSEEDRSQYLSRWLRVWIALLAVVTLVVVAYLIVITNRLASINGNLATANSAVTGADGNVRTLPQQVTRVNGSLGEIAPALAPVPGQADQIIAGLSSIDAKLRGTDSSLKDTDASLKNTSRVLAAVLGLATDVRTTLADADDPADRLGVQNIHQRVAFVNGVGSTGSFGTNASSLTAARADTENVLSGLQSVNGHLRSVCDSGAVSVIGGPKPC